MNINITEKKLLSDNWYILNRVTYNYEMESGKSGEIVREVYDRGNGATILLYHPTKKTIILTRQFRLPTYMNGNTSGMLIETCAGLLDKDNAEECIKRETQEETGYLVKDVKKIFEAYMSPGSVTEIVHFFVAEYDDQMKINDGGGLESEQENIEVLEMSFAEAYKMIGTGKIKDAKTMMLLQYAHIHQLCK